MTEWLNNNHSCSLSFGSTTWAAGSLWILNPEDPLSVRVYARRQLETVPHNLMNICGLSKKFLWCSSTNRNKRHIFLFHQELYWMYSPFCSTTFCHVSGNFIIPSSQNCFLSFWAKNCSRCLLQSSRELKFFPLTEFGKDWNKWKSKSAMSGKYSGWIRTSQPSYDSFRLVIEEACSTVLSWRTFLTDSGGFRWVLLSVGLIGNSTCWN